jgi:hypothetical protein
MPIFFLKEALQSLMNFFKDKKERIFIAKI